MKSFKRLFDLFIFTLAVFGLTAGLSYALNIDNQSSSINNSVDPNSADTTNKSSEKVTLIIQISVPHNKGAIESCRIYPYPVAPPKKKADVDPLPTKDKDLRQLVLTMSYFLKSRQEKPYPTGGWRMQAVMEAAIRKSGLGVPHTIFTEYSWSDNIIPYARKEVISINAKEKERKQRWDLAQATFNENRADLEVQSFNQGLFPIDVPIRREIGGYRRGKVVVDKANWWIVAMHKVPGLKYYWLWPVKLNDNAEQLVVLNEDNAIFINGAW